MNNKYKISLFLTFIGILFIFSGIMLSPVNSQAPNVSINTILRTNMTELKLGQEVIIALDLDDYSNVKKGYNAYKATLVYDKDVFEPVTQNDFLSLNSWEELEYNPTTGEFVAIKKAGSKELENVVQIKLKVKKTASVTNTTISMTDIVTSEGKKDITISDKNIDIRIVKDQSNSSNTANNSSNSSTTTSKTTTSNNKNTSDINNQSISENTSKEDPSTNIEKDYDSNTYSHNNEKIPNKSTKKTKIENTQKNYLILYLMILILLQLLLIIIYYKKRKEENDKYSKKILMLLFIGLFYFQIAGSVYASYNDFLLKGELNGDSQINYNDLKILESHLIHKNNIGEDFLENADMNSDGYITITDLTLLVQKLENTLDYEVKLSNLEQESKYVFKNTAISLTFKADVNYNAKITKVKVNDIYYDVLEDSTEEGKYKIIVNGFEEAGTKDIIIEKVKLSNSKELEVESNNKVQIEVLKTKPIFDNYRIVEDINEPSLTILFDLIDPDNSITNSNVKFIDENNKVIKTAEAKKGTNNIKLPVEDGKKYKAKFDIEYNLTTEERPSDSNLIGTISLDKDLQLNINYNFVASNFKTYNDAGEETTLFEKDQTIKIMFDSSNTTTHEVNKIRINGKDYNVNKENNKYVVSLSGINQLGTNVIKIDKITLDNNKSFDIKQNISVVIIKTIPKITGLALVENSENNQIFANFEIKDEDEAIIGMKVRLTNENNKLLGQIDLTDKEIKTGKISKVFAGTLTSKYKVSILATYSQTDKASDIKTDVVLAEKEIEAIAKAEIVEIISDKSYCEKGSNATLTYTINTNKTEDITKITIDGKDYDTSKLSDGKYQVIYKNETTSGVKSLKTTKVTYSNKDTANVNKTIKIEVLKDLPTISNFKQVDNTDSNKVTLNFNLNDTDNSLISGEATLTNKVDGTVTTKVITKGKNSLEFTVRELELYQLTINVTYDRDSNTLSNNIEENRELNKTIDTRNIQLITNYNLSISDMITSKNEVNTKYFEKNEDIILQFKSTNVTNFEIVEVTINNNKYEVVKNNDYYQVKIKGYSSSGVKTLTIEKAKLSNTKELNITKDNNTKIEILKDKPTIKDFKYEEESSSDISVKFNIVDLEKTITSGKVLIIEDGLTIKEQDLEEDKNTIKFTPKTGRSYIAKVLVNYDLDSNKLSTDSNEYTNETLLEEEISLGNRVFEFKDIVNSIVYKQTNDKIEEVEQLNLSDLSNLDNYIVKVQMKKMPTFYTTIKEYHVDKNRLKLTLDYEDVVQYNGDTRQDKLEIDYGEVVNGVAENISLAGLIKRINDNPNGSYKLTQDYDASSLSNNDLSLVTETFTGTLNGNGHKIINLTQPLFNNLEGATIKNIILEDVVLFGANSKGSIANTATDTTITDVHIKGLKLTTGANHTAGLIGEATNTNVEQSSVTNFTITTSGHIRISAMIGKLTGGSIKNCYVNGVLNSTQSKDGNGIGGILGHGFETINIENCISKVKITNTEGKQRLNGALVGVLASRSSVLKNNISLSTGTNFYSIHGNEPNSTATNNYELIDSGLTSNVSGNRIIQISKNDINSLFYKERANFDETIWNLSGTTYNKLPVLKNDDPNNKIEEALTREDLYIPDLNRIKKVNGYDKNKQLLYHNLNKLMPYYDAKYLIEDGAKINTDHVLNKKMIKYIFAYDDSGKQVLALGQNEYNKLKKIRIVFEDNESISYDITYKDSNKLIAIYDIKDLGIYYSSDRYLVDNNSQVYNYIVNYIKDSDYINKIAILTDEEENRNYIDNYVRVKNNAEAIALKLMANVEGFNYTCSSSVLTNKVLQYLNNDKTLDKILYAYNYYDRIYNFEIGGLNIRDIVFFDGRILNDKFNAINMTNNIFNTTSNNRAIYGANNFFNAYISPLSGKGIYDFVDYFIKNFTNEKYKNDSASWIIDNYQGVIYEEKAPRYPNMRARVWDHLKARPHLILYILSYPGDDLYVLGVPTTLLVGNFRLYYSNFDSVPYNTKLNYLKNFASMAVPFYDSVAGVVEKTAGFTNISNFSQISYDSTVGKDWSSDPNAQPVFKYFYEALNHWITKPAGSAAFANGTDINWVADRALSDFTVFSHEAVHNQDGRIFLEGTGRRRGAGAEHFTDNFLTQPYPNSIGNTITGTGIYGVIPNYTYTRPFTGVITNNISKDRINTREKIESYYKGMYDAFAFLDYIEAQAFLQLTPEEQCQIAQIVEDNSYVWKTAEDFKNMNLKTIEDIWDNHLVIIRGNKAYTTGSFWYLYANPEVGAAGKAFFVLNAYQFLADFGYDGYVGYAGNSNGALTDEEILKKISKDPNITFKSYQLGRYNKVAEKIKTYAPIDVDDAIVKTLEAMKIDVKNNMPIDINSNASTYRESLYGYLKRITNDFEVSIYEKGYNNVHIKTVNELIEKINKNPEINIVLDNDLDFSDINVRMETKSYINSFVGTFDGNNHKITGLKRPLFDTIIFANVKNLKLENSETTSYESNSGVLSRYITFSFINNISLKDLSISGIRTVGGIAGNVTKTTVSNVKYENINVSLSSNTYNAGGLFGAATYLTIENTHGINSTVSGTDNIGGIIGNANYLYKVSGCSFNGEVISRGKQAGGLIGNAQNSIIKDSYVLGNVTGNSNVGGLVGQVATSNITNTYNAATVKGNLITSTGGLFGNVLSGSYHNNISFARVNNGYKVYGNSTQSIVEAGFNNNYELIESMGHSTSEKSGINFTNRITPINITNLNNNFYTETLKFDSKIWDLSNVSKNGLPKLKNDDPNNINQIIQRVEINSASDFEKLNQDPTGDFILTKDIDFTGFNLKENTTSVVNNVFIGRIDGNGHTIKNLTNASLFADFRGAVINLNMRDINIQATENNIAAFAKTSSNATFKNMKFENITLTGANNVGTVVGTDNKDSIFDRISVKNTNITTTTMFAGGIVGAQYGGRISNVFVEGKINITQLGAGGIIGATGNGTSVIVTNAVAKVDINRTSDTDRQHRKNNAGLIGFIADVSKLGSVNNSIALGNMEGFNEEMIPFKFINTTEEIINSKVTNCYEVLETKGISSVTRNTTGHLNTIERKNLNKEFYKSLAFDEEIWNLDKVFNNGYPELR